MKYQRLFFFVKSCHGIRIPDSKTAFIGANVTSKEELLKYISKQLEFTYFSCNWSSLNDSLCDFENIKEHNVVILHEPIALDNTTLFDYLVILLASSLIWLKYPEEHRLLSFFSKKDKKRIMEVLNSDEMRSWFDGYCKSLGFDF